MRRILLEPDRRGDPPALAVPEQLQRVDPASLHGAVGGAPLLVRAPHLRDVAVRAGDAVDLPLVEALVDELRVRRVHERLVVHDARVGLVLGDAGGDEAEVRDVEGAVARPLSRLTRRSRDHVDRKSTRLNSCHVAISYAVFCLKKKTYYFFFCTYINYHLHHVSNVHRELYSPFYFLYVHNT